jgi:integrase
MLSVARRLLDEAVYAGKLVANPAKGIRGFRVSNETPHTALTRVQAKELLQAIDRTSILGMRDYAMLLLLLRTGIRRSECAALNIGDIKAEQGHHVAMIEHGKGDKRRIVKLPVDVFRAIEDYVKIAQRRNDPSGLDAPLFTGCTKAYQPTMQRISDKLIERTVIKYGKLIGVPDLTPHGLRASFITLAIEGGATLEQAQYAAGHSDPRTTERYRKRKLNLDDNAVDYIKL